VSTTRLAWRTGAALLAAVPLAAQEPAAAEDRAVAYLSREVPGWRSEHACGSCHNNGDAARALLRARQLGRAVDAAALENTLAWLRDPGAWEKAPGEPGTADLVLARLQFGAALAAAVEAAAITDRAPLLEAARRIASDQAEDGGWRIAHQSRLGSPVTWGRSVATWLGRETLRAADPDRHAAAIARAEAWLMETPADSVMEAAVRLLALDASEDARAEARRADAEAFLLRARGSGGGWGPWPGSPPEAFDTALALLALHRRDPDAHREAIAQARRFLASLQLGPGGWPETTRPAGYQSYAQHISTSGWAALALLETAPSR
jgi:hypothetical protein